VDGRPSRTTVEFEVGHLWSLHTVRGRFRSFDDAYVVGRGGSEIELTIDAGSVDTGCVARDTQLRSADFSTPTGIRRCGSRRRAPPDWEADART
jgi:polyisoprenoid-binding protein YceI